MSVEERSRGQACELRVQGRELAPESVGMLRSSSPDAVLQRSWRQRRGSW